MKIDLRNMVNEMNRLENYYLAKDALSHIEGMGEGEQELVRHANSIMDDTFILPPHIRDANDIIDALDDMKQYIGIPEEKRCQQAFDLICEKCIEHQRSLCDDEEFEQWYHDVLTNWGGRNDL